MWLKDTWQQHYALTLHSFHLTPRFTSNFTVGWIGWLVGLSIAWFVHQASNRLWMSTGRSYNPFFNYPFAHTHTRRHVSAHLPNPIQFLSSFSQTDERTQCVAFVVIVIVFGRLGITQSCTEVHYGNRILIARKLLPRALFCNLIIVLCLSVRLSAFYSSKTWTWHIKHRTQDRQTDNKPSIRYSSRSFVRPFGLWVCWVFRV